MRSLRADTVPIRRRFARATRDANSGQPSQQNGSPGEANFSRGRSVLATWRTWTPILLLTVGAFFPDWVTFALSYALANGIAALGIVVLMRTGNVTFGQSLFFCIGAYAGALIPRLTGVGEAVVIVAAAIVTGGLLAALLGLFLKRFAGIFFAMLTLAMAMVLYGLLAKAPTLGGTDGLSVQMPTFLSVGFDGFGPTATYVFTAAVALGVVAVTQRLLKSWIGIASIAVGKNDIRVTYLGGNVQGVVWVAYIYAGVLGAVGGALAGIVSGHVAPEMAYWTKSGELVLIALLGNSANAIMVLLASVIIEAIRVFAATEFPHTWQAVLGVLLLAIILLLPDGLDPLVARFARNRSARNGE